MVKGLIKDIFENKDETFLKYLIDEGKFSYEYVNQTNFEELLFIYTCSFSHKFTVSYSSYHCNAVTKATTEKNIPLLQFLLKRPEFDIDEKDWSQMTALIWGAGIGNTEAVRALIERG